MVAGTRRRFLLSLAGAGVASSGLGARMARAQAPSGSLASGSLAAIELRGGLALVTGAGANVVVMSRPEGLLMVDTGSPASASSLQRFVTGRFPAATVEALFNTHWHLEHTGGNEALAHDDTTIVAHENTRLWMSTKFYVEWEDRRYSPRSKRAWPNKTFVSSERQPLELGFGGETVYYGHLPQAHTDGDIYVAFPDQNVIVAGGTVSVGRYPVLDYITGGWVGGMMDALQTLIDMADAETLIIPNAGPPQNRTDLQNQLQMLSAVRERVEAMALQGRGIDDMIAAGVTAEFEDRYSGDVELFISNMYEGLWWNRLRAI